MLDIHKYDKKRLNKNSKIDKKIKSLFLLFDKSVEDFKLNFKQSIQLIDNWIKVFIDSEEYEIADAFKKRKIRKWKKIRKFKRIWSVKLFYRVWRFRFYKLSKIR
jgi:hypothetical protein